MVHATRNLAIFVGAIALIGAFLFLPFLPYSVAGNDHWAFLGIRANASVSPLYTLTNCGVVYNPTISTTFGTAYSVVSLWNGAHWTCGAQWTQTPWSPA